MQAEDQEGGKTEGIRAAVEQALAVETFIFLHRRCAAFGCGDPTESGAPRSLRFPHFTG